MIFFIFSLLLVDVSNASQDCEKLYRAAEMGELETIKRIVTSNPGGASCSGKWGYTPLHGVVTGHGHLVDDDLKIVKFLVDNGANVEAKAQGGITPLHITPYPEIVELLVKNGANLEATDNQGRTAIIFYAEDSNGPAALIKALELGANVNHRDKKGRSALDMAIKREESEKISILKKHGAK